MKKMFLLVLPVLLLSACLKEEGALASLEIRVSAPEQFPDLDYTSIKVKVQNVYEPVTHQKALDARGCAAFTLNPGSYTIVISSLLPNGYTVSASVSEFLLTDKGMVDDKGMCVPARFDLRLGFALSGGLIIREAYYAGSKTLEGANYSRDQYIELYNNSDAVVYLDSLGVGALAPVNSTVTNNPWAGSDTLALFQMAWMIPGSGRDYPLAPGESAVLALNAVDHGPRCTSGLDLSKAHFGFYDDALTHEKHPDVPALLRIFAGKGTAYAISVSSPALVIFRPMMGIRAWIDDAATWQHYQPGSSAGLIYIHIHKSWILDAVECAANANQTLKRVPGEHDASYTYLHLGRNRGNAVSRKIKETLDDGRIIYMDTNNSADDFDTDVPANPHLKR